MTKKENSLIQSSATVKDDNKQVEQPKYSEEEKTYLGNLKQRLISDQTEKESPHEEFDGLGYSGYWYANEQCANTQLQAAKNKGDTVFQSGTLRNKMESFVSAFQSMNLEQDISAFNQNNLPIQGLGDAMETVIVKTEEMELDEEKRMLRQFEMLKQGDVFLEEQWIDKWMIEKSVNSPFSGSIATTKWDIKPVKEMERPERTIISGLSVYLGDIHQYFIENQPHIFTCSRISYSEAEKLYGKWDRWQYVSRNATSFSNSPTSETWILSNEIQKDQVERIIYQDQSNNEIQILLNGVMMLPVGYPLSAISPDGKYTIVQQHLDPIRHDFAYGKSFIFRNKNIVAVFDRMIELAVLKTHKSFMPPRANLSERIVSPDMFMAGKITRGIKPGEVPLVDDRDAMGVTNSEFAMIQEVKKFINESTASQTFSGQMESGGNVTATQISELQRQARMMMAIMTLAACLLEKKLTKRRLGLLIQKWFDPIDTTMDEVRGALKNQYRTVTQSTEIRNEGMGIRMVRPTEQIPTSGAIRSMEESYKEKTGIPIQIIYVNVKEIKNADTIWQINIVPKEKKSNELRIALWNQMMAQLIPLAGLGLVPKKEWLEKNIAQMWEQKSEEIFDQIPPQGVQPPQGGKMPVSGANPRLTPRATPQAIKKQVQSPAVLR